MDGVADPGHSRNGGKCFDLEGGDEVEGSVDGMADPGHSRNGGKCFDLESGRVRRKAGESQGEVRRKLGKVGEVGEVQGS